MRSILLCKGQKFNSWVVDVNFDFNQENVRLQICWFMIFDLIISSFFHKKCNQIVSQGLPSLAPLLQFGAWYKGFWSEWRCVNLVLYLEGGKPTYWLACYLRVTASGAIESFRVCFIFYFSHCISWCELNRVPTGF